MPSENNHDFVILGGGVAGVHGKTSLCDEIFCSQGDEVWRRSDPDVIEPVLADLDSLRFLPRARVREA